MALKASIGRRFMVGLGDGANMIHIESDASHGPALGTVALFHHEIEIHCIIQVRK